VDSELLDDTVDRSAQALKLRSLLRFRQIAVEAGGFPFCLRKIAELPAPKLGRLLGARLDQSR
jgi:hypothetical protein